MAVFLDVHKVPFKEENLQELVNAPADEYGVRMSTYFTTWKLVYVFVY
jgi:hypothetical protein